VLQGRAARRTLGGAVAISILLHVAAVAIAVLAFGRHAPAAEDPAAITVFIPPAPPAAPVTETSEAKPVEPPPPEPDFTLPPPEESLAIPDFKSPPPPPPKEPPPKAATPPPKTATPPPKPAPPKPAVAAVPHAAPAAPSVPQQMVPPVNSTPSPSAAPSIVPGWNVQLAAWLAAHKNYPNAARQRGEEGEVMVRFTVEDNGRVSAVSIDKSSGHADLDAAALRMLQGANLPAPGAIATRTVRIRFRLDD
jgi:protein TonB